MTDNHTLTTNLHQLDSIRNEIAHLDSRITDLQHRRTHLTHLADDLASIDLIHDGTAITITGFGANVYRPTDRTNGRRSQVYESCRFPGTWRVRAEYQDPRTLRYPQGWSGGQVLPAADTDSQSAAVQIACDWIVHGTYPGLTAADMPAGMVTDQPTPTRTAR